MKYIIHTLPSRWETIKGIASHTFLQAKSLISKKITANLEKMMVSSLGKVCCTIALVCVISTTVKGTHMQSVKSNILKIPFSVTAGQPPECEQSNDDSCPQLEVLRGRDGRDGRDGERDIPGERGKKGERGPIEHSGARGPLGPLGEKGQPGEKGERGSVGLSGATGAHGQKGANGQKGQRGERGQLGTHGAQGQKGEPGERGLTGPAGSVMNCGQTYVRWGRTTCPGNQSTELVYSGRAGGSWYSKTGGATNYLCMPDNPDYLQYDSDIQRSNHVYGVEYETHYSQPLRVNPNVQGHNVPCAECMAVSRCSLLMIPGKTSCPVSWTTEYVGYLMSGGEHHALPTTYECVDKDPESVPGLDAVGWGLRSGGGIFNHVDTSCNGMACPPYVAGRELTCVVCTH